MDFKTSTATVIDIEAYIGYDNTLKTHDTGLGNIQDGEICQRIDISQIVEDMVLPSNKYKIKVIVEQSNED